MPVEIFEKGGRAPEKHSGVPVIVAGTGVHFRNGKRRLFGEAPHCINRETFGIERIAHALDIAETRFRARRRNAKDDHTALAAGDVQSGAHDDAVALGIGDVMVGRENR